MTPMTPELHAYLVAHGTPPDAVQADLIAETQAMDNGGMQIAPEQGAFMTILARLLNAKLAVEVGTFTGYSALCVARGLADGGRLICCDVSDEWTSIARKYWDRAGVADRIDLRLGPGEQTLKALPPDPVIDLVFLDADKPGYITYWEELVPRMRPGGVILVDNVLNHGRVVDEPDARTAQVIHAFNEHAAADDRVDIVMLTIADGLTLARKR